MTSLLHPARGSRPREMFAVLNARCGTATAPPNTPRRGATRSGIQHWSDRMALRAVLVDMPMRRPGQAPLGKDVIQRTLANAARTGANPASVMQSENDNVPALRRP